MSPVVRSMGDLRDFLSQWDKASKSTREKILHDFVKRSRNMTGPELEREYGNGASLLLTRICAYLRTRTLAGTSIGMSMQAISVFVSASSGHRFLVEFLDSGGLQMVLQVIRNTNIDEVTIDGLVMHLLERLPRGKGNEQRCQADRMKALQVLFSISNAGYTYKELICEPPTNGIASVCEFMCEVESETAHEITRSVLIGLSRGNKRGPELQTILIPKLTSSSPLVQRTAAQVVRQLLAPPEVEGIKAIAPEPSIVPALRSMLACTHVHVTYEAQELANCALVHESTRQAMVDTALELLRPGAYAFKRPVETPGEEDLTPGHEKSPAAIAYFSAQVPPECLIQQAAACRLLASFLKSKVPKRVAAQPEVIRLLLASDVVMGLLVALSNADYAESKKHAVDCLRALMKKSRDADDRFLECTGQDFYQHFIGDPNGCAAMLDKNGLDAMLKATGATAKKPPSSETKTADNNQLPADRGASMEEEEEHADGPAHTPDGGAEATEDTSRNTDAKPSDPEASAEDSSNTGTTELQRAAPELSAADTHPEGSVESIGFKGKSEGEEGQNMET